MAEKVTLATIAKACHLSVGTVSRALNDRSDISQATKQQVAQVARELGYRKSTEELGVAVRIGVVYCRRQTDFYNDVTAGIQKAREELGPRRVTVDLLQTEYLDQAEQTALLSSLQPENYDGLLINSAGVETGNLINRLTEQGLPVATFNTDAPSSKRLFFVGSNAYQAGQVGAYLLGKMLGGKGKVLLVGSILGKTAWVDRFSSAYAVLHNDFPEVEIVPLLQENYTREDVERSIGENLSAHPDLAGMLLVNNAMTCDVIDVLREKECRDICVVGFDITRETRSGVQDGYCDAVLYQDPFAQGYRSVMTMVDYLTTGNLPSADSGSIPPTIVMKYNIDSF